MADLFGPAEAMPATPADFAAFLGSGRGIAPTLDRIAGCFRPGEAAAPALPGADADTAFACGAVENSVAARHAAHPVMRAIEAAHGRGPLWRATARAYDIEACLTGTLPLAATPAPGRALVPATRGLYAVTARAENGMIAAFARVTPTDHLLAGGGILDHTLASLPAMKHGLAPLILDILDPCSPVRLKEVADA